ncbi:hypothetical protein RN001_012667 [Aquatica leii]|uniref:Uncharacterized protein n=1 Tax=Aquatica leii TaxID=1421715 RepID=A0AAN7Q1U9_9COLE|nr:hypothetical protein RN001_012667 [Aquatica leii]
MEDNCNNKCRACLSENDAMLSLFEVYEHDLTLAMILKSCISNVEVSENDGLPSYLCDNCILVLTQFYNFTVVYEESDRYLKSLFKKNIKHVPINIPVEVDVSELKEEQKDEVLELQEVCELTDSNSGDVLFGENELKQQIEELKEEVLDEKDPQLTEQLDVVTTIMPVYEEVTKYECTICGEAHLYASAFQQHMRVKHRMSDIDCKPYASKIQIKVFENLPKKPIQTQVKTDEGEDPSSYVCKYCNKKCAYAGQLQQHLKLHEGNKKYICEVCGACFIRKTYLDDHKEGHSTEKKHVCKFCGKAFRRRTVLRAHKRVHTHPNHYVCEICGRAFTNSSTLKTHKLLIHIRERNFHCVICNLKFPLKSTLNKHILRHQKRENGEKGFNCSQCPMQYRDKSSLKRHVESKHQGTIELIPCYDCPKRYTSKANLLKHIKRHHSANMVVAEEVVL